MSPAPLTDVDGLAWSRDGVVLTATLDRGDDRNLLTMAAVAALSAVLADPPVDAHVLRLTARGSAFCLGRERTATTVDDARGEATAIAALTTTMRHSPLVVVAEVQGDAAGLGVGLVANADVALAAGTVRLWLPEVRIDLAPTVVLSWLPAIVGRQRAFLMAATGEPIDADTAARLRLVTEVVPAADLTARVDALVATLTAASAHAHRDIKTYLADAEGLDPAAAEALAVERLAEASLRRRTDGEH